MKSTTKTKVWTIKSDKQSKYTAEVTKRVDGTIVIHLLLGKDMVYILTASSATYRSGRWAAAISIAKWVDDLTGQVPDETIDRFCQKLNRIAGSGNHSGMNN